MDQNRPEPTFDEGVNQVMQTLPPVIRAYLVQGRHTTIAKSLMTKYGLRIDQGGVLEQEIILLLMGIDTPDEFIQALTAEAQLDQQVITGIVQDVNAQIFVPLRAEMMSAGGGPASGGKSGAGNTSMPQPAGVVGPPPQSPSYFHLENKIPVTRPAQGTLNTGRPISTTPPRPPVASSVGGTRPGERSSLRDVLAAITKTTLPVKPMDNRKLLEDHEEPHIELGVRDKVQGVRTLVVPPLNLPGALPPKPSVPATPVAPAKPYSSDPYREPIE